MLPPLYAILSRDLNTSEANLGLATAVYVLLAALAAALFGYRGDKTNRRHLLILGTLLWASAMIATGFTTTIGWFFLWQSLTAVGVGAISSLGFSVISDLIPAHRRGLALSIWSMSQLIGGAIGAALASTIGAFDWRWVFWLIAATGLIFAALYTTIPEPERGQSDPELAPVFAAGSRYTHRINRASLRQLWQRRANRWLLLNSFLISLAVGSTVWIPRWAIARVQAEGYPLETATVVGNLFLFLFNVGVFTAIPAGHLGDRWQQHNVHGRTHLALIGLLGSIPFFITLYFLPLRGIVIPVDGNLLALILAAITSLFSNGWVLLMFIVAFLGVSLYAADGPNWAALITEVNLPEQRGTVLGLNRLARALGNAISIATAGFLFAYLSDRYPAPLNFAIGLALFQLLVIPAALCYLGVRRTIAQDTAAVKTTLTNRAKQLMIHD